MVAVEADVANSRRWDQPEYTLDHTEAGSQYWNESQLFPADVVSGSMLQWRVHTARLDAARQQRDCPREWFG